MKRRLVVLCVVAAGCGDNTNGTEAPPDGEAPGGDAIDAAGPDDDHDAGPPDADTSFPFVRCDEARAPLPPLLEDRTVYDQDTLGLWTVHLTVEDLEGLAAVNAGVEGAEVPVVFTEGGFTSTASLRIRGGASRVNAQKNYKVELDPGNGLWRGQREINLNKHMWDLTRMRNKMAFDLFKTIPDFTSLRTQFVQMFVNGENYGLYTWIEEADKRFLRSHGLDPDGQLYKAAGFHFAPIDPIVAADPVAFKLIVEAKANPDDAKFLRMVEAVNDYGRDFDEVMATYFNRDNLVTWLAVNVLLNNIDTRTQNYYLYSPSSCEGWYFMPWDYDGAWGFYGQLSIDDRDRWESGLTNWWPVKLFERFFLDPENVMAVHAKIMELSQTTLTDALTVARIDSYRPIVGPHISVQPDLRNIPGHHGNAPPSVAIELWEGEMTRISTTVSRFLAEYQYVVERPMPSRVSTNLTGSPLRFRWDDSYDLQNDALSYDFQVSTTPFFAPADIVVEQLGIVDDETTVQSLPSGVYFWRIIIRDHKHADSWQFPFDPHKMIAIP